nr:unnamed protein product [Callosobruchus chinensis]
MVFRHIERKLRNIHIQRMRRK